VKQPYLDKARAKRILKMEKAGGRPAEEQPRLLDAEQVKARDLAVEALVAGAADTPAAWDALGPRDEKKAQELSNALRERWVRIETGRKLVAGGKPVTPAVTARFTELHLQRLELRWRLERCVFPGAPLAPTRLAALADEETHAVLGANAHRHALWPADDVQRWMHAVNQAVRTAGEETVKSACKAMVEAACEAAYGGGS
jgi:hypothetical protein